MKQGQRARLEPLLLNITTAGSLIDGPCHQLQQFVERILQRQFPNEAIFGIIYTVTIPQRLIGTPEAATYWQTEEALRMANPNWGVSVYIETILQEQQDAINAAYLQNAFRTKTLNEWMNAGVAWMNMAKWDECADPKLRIEEFAGEKCDEGEDLSAKIDLASRCKIFTRRYRGKFTTTLSRGIMSPRPRRMMESIRTTRSG